MLPVTYFSYVGNGLEDYLPHHFPRIMVRITSQQLPDPPSCLSWRKKSHLVSFSPQEPPPVAMSFQKFSGLVRPWYQPASSALELHPTRSHGCPIYFKHSLTCYPCTKGKALVQAFPLVSVCWDSWRPPEGKDWGKGSTEYLGLFHLHHHHCPCSWGKFTQSLRPLLGWASKWEE